MIARSALKRPAFAAALLAMFLVYLAVLVSNERILFASRVKPSPLPEMIDKQDEATFAGDGRGSSVLSTSARKADGTGAGGEGEGEGDGGGGGMAWPSSWGEYVAVNPGATLPNRGRTEGERGRRRNAGLTIKF